MEWLKDGGLIDGVSEDLEKIKQQIKRRKMTLKRKQNKSCQSTSSSSKDGPSSEESTEESTEEYALEDMFSEEPEFTGSTSVDAGFDVDEEDPLCNAKITLLQDDSYVSFVDSPPADRNDTPVYDFYHRQAEHGLQVEVPQDAAAEDFFDNGPYSPTSVVYEVAPPLFGFNSAYESTHSFESVHLFNAMDLFPRTAREFPTPPKSCLKKEPPAAPAAFLVPEESCNQTEV